MRRNAEFRMEWYAPEHEHKERGSEWFWTAGIIVAALAIVSVIFGNLIFALLIILATFSLSLFINREPDLLHVVLDQNGITREMTHFPFHSLESFWIDIDHPHKKILLRSKKLLMPIIIVPISDDVDAERIHRILLRILPEEYHALPFVERILERLGF